MTDSANFQIQMSEIWKARREREMYRLDLEKEVYTKMQRREKRRDELRSKVKALHDDLVREDITSSQRVKTLFSKVESLKREHQILAAHTERLKLKKRQIELQLVTSYPIIHQAVQQEIKNSHLPVGHSQVGHNVFLQTSQASGPPQPWQYSVQLQHEHQQQQQQQQQPNQPYNVTQLGGVGDTVYRGIPGIISTVNSEIDNNMAIFSTRESSKNHTQANQPANNEQFNKPSTCEDHRNEGIQKYLSTLENRCYSNSVSSTSEPIMQMTNNGAVAQCYSNPVASSSHFSAEEQVLNQHLNHRHTAIQGGINSEVVHNPPIQRENSNYSPQTFSEQRLYSHQENNDEINPQLKSNFEINSNESLFTAHKANVAKTLANNAFISPSCDLENMQSSSERESISNRAPVYNKDQEYIHDTQIQKLERNEESITSDRYIQKPYENIQHIPTNQNQSQESTYQQHISEKDIPDEIQKNLDQNQSELNNGPNNDIEYEHNENSYNDGNQYDNYKTENFNSNQDSQNYRENESEYSSNAYTNGDYSQTENKIGYSQEPQNIRNQTEENYSNMEYQKNASESQNYDEYGNKNPDSSHYMESDIASYEKQYEEHNYNDIKNKHVDQESLQNTSNIQTSTMKTPTRTESLTSTTKQETLTKQYTEESKNDTSSFNKDNNILDEDSDFFERAAPSKSSAAYQNLLGVAAPSMGLESDSDEMEGQMAAMALKSRISNSGPSFKAFASTIPSLKPNAANLTDSDSVDSVEAAIQAAMNKKAEHGEESSDMKSSENKANICGSTNANPVAVSKGQQSMGVTTHLSAAKTKPKGGATALQLNLSDDESYNVSGGGNDSYDDDDDFFD